jgi:glycosyltransferase involved in cell wall biosynthesis
MPPKLVQRVYPGLDIDRFRQRVHHSRDEVRAALRIPVDKFVVAMVANLREWKGQHVLLSALSLVPRSLLASLHVLLIGATAPEDRRYHGALVETKRESLSEHVTLLGFRRDIPDLMNASDLIVHASVTPEPFGRVIAEAMALGKVVIAANRVAQ